MAASGGRPVEPNEAMLGDAALWPNVVEGSHAAFEQLFRRHEPRVRSFALRRTGNHSDAEDVVAETFIAAWKQRKKIKVEESLLPWLITVAARLSAKHTRKVARNELLMMRADMTLSLIQRDHAEGVVNEMVARQRLLDVLGTIEALPPDQRIMVELVVLGGLKPTEAASALGIPAATARTRLARARATLSQVRGTVPPEGGES